MEIGSVEAEFLNEDVDKKCLNEWTEGMQEFCFIPEAEKQQYCIHLTKEM
jgi:hypothetical protein